MENKDGFFDFAAYVGLTKHLGGIAATEKLVAVCHIGEGQYILDVGCGVGVTACYIAKKHHCHVVGVDLSEGMVSRSRERAHRERVDDQVEFRAADAQELPFANDLFDVVITESVTAFPEDKQKAVNEYARVTKSGGMIGLNESTWLKVPPPPEMVAWASQDLGANVNPLTEEEWVSLLKNAGLKDIQAKTYAINVQNETSGILQRYGWGGMLKVFSRMMVLYARNPAYRKFVSSVRQEGVAPANLSEYFGYGLYIGCK